MTLPSPDDYSNWQDFANALLQVLTTGVEADGGIAGSVYGGSITGVIPPTSMPGPPPGYLPVYWDITDAELFLANDFAVPPVVVSPFQIDTQSLALASVELAQIADGAVGTNKLADLAVVDAKIADATILSAKIGDLQVVTAKINDLAVNTAKIADLAVGTAQINDAAITTAKVGTAQIGTAQIANAAITSALILDATISTADIGNAQITTAKIGAAQITSALIANATILTADIADAQITSALILDAAILTADIGNAQITNALVANAAILTANIGSAQITTALIANAAITNALIASAAVGTANIQNAAIVSALIGNLAVQNAHIDNLTLGTGKIANAVVSDWATASVSPGQTFTSGGGWASISGAAVIINTVDNVTSSSQVVELTIAAQVTRGSGTTNTIQFKLIGVGGAQIGPVFQGNVNDPSLVVTMVFCDISPPALTSIIYQLQAQSTNGDPVVSSVTIAAKLMKK